VETEKTTDKTTDKTHKQNPEVKTTTQARS
jgi:hypothetical protein